MTTKKARREFTDEFKREAVVLLRDSGQPARERPRPGEQGTGRGYPPRARRQPAPSWRPTRACVLRDARKREGFAAGASGWDAAAWRGSCASMASRPAAGGCSARPQTATTFFRLPPTCWKPPWAAPPEERTAKPSLAVRIRGCAEPSPGKARALPGPADLTCIAAGAAKPRVCARAGDPPSPLWGLRGKI